MGLCKCRVATSQFCFNHKAHTCPACALTDHPLCVIRSYIRWLADSDFEDPHMCSLCVQPLTEGQTLRLTCFDAFHAACLNKYLSELPAHTAPAGYCCPQCKAPVVPSSEQKSALLDRVREFVSRSPWGAKLLSAQAIAAKPAPNSTNSGVSSTSQSARPSPAPVLQASSAVTSRKTGSRPAAPGGGGITNVDLEAGRDDYSKDSKAPRNTSAATLSHSGGVDASPTEAKTHAPGGAFTKPLMQTINNVRSAALPLPAGIRAGDSQRRATRRNLAIGLVLLVLLMAAVMLFLVQSQLPDAMAGAGGVGHLG